MARIRSIKPEFWTSEQIVTCSPLARLLFVGLWTFCDDGGVHPASVRRLKMEVFPADAFDDATISGLLRELVSAGLVREYEANAERFWSVTGWQRHQRIDKPTIRHPPPPDRAENSATIRRTLGEDSTNARRDVGDASPTEWSGVERNGIGEESEKTQSSPDGETDKAATASLDEQPLKPTSDDSSVPSAVAPAETARPKKSSTKFSADDMQLAREMFAGNQELYPDATPPNFDRWANSFRLLRETGRDRTPAQIRVTLAWVRQDQFWKTNILSPDKLRHHWDVLQVKIREANNAQRTKPTTARTTDGTYRAAPDRRASF